MNKNFLRFLVGLIIFQIMFFGVSNFLEAMDDKIIENQEKPFTFKRVCFEEITPELWREILLRMSKNKDSSLVLSQIKDVEISLHRQRSLKEPAYLELCRDGTVFYATMYNSITSQHGLFAKGSSHYVAMYRKVKNEEECRKVLEIFLHFTRLLKSDEESDLPTFYINPLDIGLRQILERMRFTYRSVLIRSPLFKEILSNEKGLKKVSQWRAPSSFVLSDLSSFFSKEEEEAQRRDALARCEAQRRADLEKEKARLEILRVQDSFQKLNNLLDAAQREWAQEDAFQKESVRQRAKYASLRCLTQTASSGHLLVDMEKFQKRLEELFFWHRQLGSPFGFFEGNDQKIRDLKERIKVVQQDLEMRAFVREYEELEKKDQLTELMISNARKDLAFQEESVKNWQKRLSEMAPHDYLWIKIQENLRNSEHSLSLKESWLNICLRNNSSNPRLQFLKKRFNSIESRYGRPLNDNLWEFLEKEKTLLTKNLQEEEQKSLSLKPSVEVNLLRQSYSQTLQDIKTDLQKKTLPDIKLLEAMKKSIEEYVNLYTAPSQLSTRG